MKQAMLHQTRQRDGASLAGLLAALNGAKNALRRDDCGDPIIRGSHGHVFADGNSFGIYIQCRSIKSWNAAKKMLAGICPEVRQDGDEEGIFHLGRLPTAAEAELIRRYVGIRQTRDAPPGAYSSAAIDGVLAGSIR